MHVWLFLLFKKVLQNVRSLGERNKIGREYRGLWQVEDMTDCKITEASDKMITAVGSLRG